MPKITLLFLPLLGPAWDTTMVVQHRFSNGFIVTVLDTQSSFRTLLHARGRSSQAFVFVIEKPFLTQQVGQPLTV